MLQISVYNWITRTSAVLFVLLWSFLILTTCVHLTEDQLVQFPHQIRDYIHWPKTDPKFSQADSCKYEQNYPLCIKLFKDAIEQKGLNTADSIYILNQLAFCHLKMDRDLEAQRFVQRLKQYNKRFLSVQKADYLLNEGMLSLHLANPRAAKSALNEALELYSRFYPKDHLRLALTRTELALYYHDYGANSELFENAAIKAFQSFYPNGITDGTSHLHPFSAESHFLMAHRYRSIYRDYQPGFNHCALAEKLIDSAPWENTKLLARCLGVKGLLLKKEGQFHQADSVICEGMKTLAVAQPGHPILQESYRFLMVNAAGRIDVSTELSKALFNEYKAELDLFMARYHQGQTYVNTTELKAYLFAQQKHRNADSCRAACLQVQKSISPDLPAFRYYNEETLNYLADVHTVQKNYDKALAYQLESFKTSIPDSISPKIKDWNDARKLSYSQTKANLFYFHYRAGSILLKKYREDKKNEQDIEEAVEQFILADSLMTLRLTMGEGGVLTYYQEMQDAYYDPLEAIYELKNISRDSTQDNWIKDLAFRFIERQKSFLLFREDILQGDEKIQNYLTEIKKEAKRINLLQADITETARVNCALSSFRYQKLLTKLAKEANWKFNQKIAPIQEIQKSLRPHEFIVQYKAMQNGDFLVLAVGRNNVIFEKIDTLPKVEKLVNNLNEKFLTQKENEPYDSTSAQLLYKKLISPFEKVLPKKDAELIIIPDHCLANFPFETLLYKRETANNKHTLEFLFNTHFVVYAPSWKVWNHNRHEPLPNLSQQVAFFTYNNTDSRINLSEWDIEWDAIETVFKHNARKYERRRCSKKKFLRIADQYEIIHFSLHGESNPQRLKDNQLFFKIEQKRKLDTLNGTELSDLNLKGKLIVLSACETNDGKITPEGIYSLSRAFLQAGSAYTVATLWSVEDQATSLILNSFYTYLAEDSPWVALGKAKRSYYLQEKKTAYLWAGLVATI